MCPTTERRRGRDLAELAGGEGRPEGAQTETKWKGNNKSYLPVVFSPAEGHGGAPAAGMSGGDEYGC